MEMASSSKQKMEILSCKSENNFQTENSKIKDKNIKLPNIFEELFESLIEEFPSKENLQSTINLNGGDSVKNHEQNFSCAVVKETSLLLSDLEDQLSTVLARKRFENGHTVNNMSSLTLSYARAFFAQALANLQAEVKKSDHRKEWRSISQNFTEEAAEKYINYLALQMNANRGKDELSEDFIGKNDSEELYSLLSSGSQSDEQQFSQTIALTPIANDNMMTFDSTPSLTRCTPTVGIKPKKGKGFKSPFLTPALVESSSPRASVMDYGKKSDKQFGKKRLNFSSSSYINDDPVKIVENLKINEEESLNITKSDESKEYLSNRKVFVSTLITDKTICIEPELKYECNQSLVPLKEFNCNIMETPRRKTTLMFTSPQSPPCKRLLFSAPKISHELHTSGNKNLPDDGYKITRMADALHCGKMSCKQRLSFLNRVGQGSKVSQRKRSRSLNSSPLVKCQMDQAIEISSNSPEPCMPVPSHWAPKKLKRPTVTQRIPQCRRSLVRQFQQLSVNPFMDTPPGSPGSFALLPLID